ncbi:DUF4330 domain-containing protein [Halostella salina]|uniref:DUF4330 domain-containing protein n=1 Tax=Halostella salina TaxID=1547897 RepID=UPI000EF7BA5C|nr:DUF4330 domain-containing protein [Halostella salina]
MPLIDDDGNLFGRVNVVDALVVLLVVAVVAAGAALVMGGGGSADAPANETTNGSAADGEPPGERAVRYATVELGTQPERLAERIHAGDEVAVGGANATVTDVHVSPVDGGAATTLRMRLDGRAIADGNRTAFRYGSGNLTVGDGLRLQTPEYRVNGTVSALVADGESVDAGETDIVLDATVPVEALDAIRAGEEYRVAGRTVGTVQSVTTFPTGDDATRRVRVGASLATRTEGERTTFGGAPLTIGRSVSLGLDAYTLSGTVVHRGATTMPGERGTTTVVVEQRNVSPAVAEATAVGMTESGGDGPRARIVDRRVEPATVVLTSDDGEIHRRDHPENRDVSLTVELETRTANGEAYFHGSELRTGSGVTLDFDRVRVEGTVTEFVDSTATDETGRSESRTRWTDDAGGS